jgi:nucleotidyltransferase substrate binding protein (TIGR01987 family)
MNDLENAKVDLTSLRNTVTVLQRSLQVLRDCLANPDASADLRETVRAGVIQHFEIAYEIAWKMMKRWIELYVSAEAVDGVSRRELFRWAAQNHLIDDVDRWMSFHGARNQSTHIYQEEIAVGVLELAGEFLPEAEALLTRLETRK